MSETLETSTPVEVSPELLQRAQEQVKSMSSGVVVITPEMANSILRDHDYPKQRHIRQWQVRRLSKAIQAGRYRPSAITFANLHGHEYLVNGRHRMNAVLVSGVPIPAYIERVQVKTEREMDELYFAIDQGMTRTFTDACNSSDLLNAMGLKQHELKAAASAVKAIMDSFQQGTISTSLYNGVFRDHELILDECSQWQSEITAFFDTLNDADRQLLRPLLSQGIMGVALVTFRFQPETARRFWTEVAQNDGLRKGTPTHTMVRELSKQAVSGRRQANRDARVAATCWNAYCQDREIHQVRIPSVVDPIQIVGTPYNGRFIIRHPVCSYTLTGNDIADERQRQVFQLEEESETESTSSLGDLEPLLHDSSQE